MDWKQEAKRELRNYDALRESLPNIKARLESLAARKISLRSVGDSTPVQGGGNHYEDRLLDIIVEENRLKYTYKASKIRLELIERGLKVLTETERTVVEQFATNKPGKAVTNLIELIGYERTQIYKIWDEALYRFTLAEYGIPEF